MKKILIAAVAVMSLASCHNNDDDTGTGEALLFPQSGTDTNEDGTVTSSLEYDGNKLTKITWSDDTYETYTYQNGKLTYLDFYIDGDLVEKKTFTYNGDKLASLSVYDYEYEFESITEYTYNSSTSIAVKEYSRDYDDGEASDAELTATGTLTLTDGNITEFVRAYTWGETETYTYTFDDKKDPYVNVFAHDILILSQLEGGKNNTLSVSYTGSSDGYTINYSYTYNAQGYAVASNGSYGSSYTINY